MDASEALRIERKENGFVVGGQLSTGAVSPESAVVSRARRAVEQACREHGVPPRTRDRLLIAVFELLENACRCSPGSPATVRFECALGQGKALVTVVNHARASDVQTLLSRLELSRQGDPLDAYLAAMEEAAARSGPRSMLGLQRLRYDAGVDLAVSLSGDEVTITAVLEAA